MSAIENIEVRVRGTVQGVGFRPTVWRLAHDNDLVGEVHNDSEGVLIRVSGQKSDIANFLTDLPEQAPPLSKIDAIEVQSFEQSWNFRRFEIAESAEHEGITEISPDAATCEHCLQEVYDSKDRRYFYPFTNCTHCGPRLSIVQGIPYDRAKTTMSAFPMCPECKSEYRDPADRRFHAQPNACHRCGPRIYLESCDGTTIENPVIRDDCEVRKEAVQSSVRLDEVQRYLSRGKIVAIRGVGGFHLCVDATNHEAVSRLRQRKQRYGKPFALMSDQLKTIEQYCHVSDIEAKQLQSNQAPIVLMERKKTLAEGVQPLSEDVAPSTHLLGFMMPYTPLHWIVASQYGKPLVMTSGNLSHEPQITDNVEAIEKLSQIADLILYHDRDIANRIDDSVVRCMAGKPRLLRRARGFAPRSVHLPEGFENCPDLLAYGAELKSTFCLVKSGSAVVSQHQGDLENVSTFDDFEKNLALYTQIFSHKPSVLVCDKHPQYLSTQMAQTALEDADDEVELIQVQHHHAHIAGCMAENEIPLAKPGEEQTKVLGLAMDGLGFGEDGTIWGGEFMVADYCSYERVGRLQPVAMIGGAQSILVPWRNTYAQILNAMDWQKFSEQYGNTELSAFFDKQQIDTMAQMINKGVNVPLASSCGRLFDAVSAALDICRERAQYEGQGAIEMESMVDESKLYDQPYAFAMTQDNSGLLTLDPTPMWPQLLGDLLNQTPKSIVATRFHGGLINAMAETAIALMHQHDIDTAALSGGCFQNKILLEGLTAKLQKQRLRCLSHSIMPSNDGGISLGQAAIAAAQMLQRKSTGA